MYADFRCAVHPGGRVEYLVSWYFNGEMTMRYNSTVGRWTGLTPAGSVTASQFNGDEHDVLQRKLERQLICVNNVALVLNVTQDNTGK